MYALRAAHGSGSDRPVEVPSAPVATQRGRGLDRVLRMRGPAPAKGESLSGQPLPKGLNILVERKLIENE